MPPSDNQQGQIKRCVYVVDPDASLHKRLETLLGSASREVKTFASAEAFLAQERSITAGCLIIGSDLPGMGTVELVHHFKRRRAHIPVIVLGEYGALPAAVRVMRAGAVEFIEKPFTDNGLRVCVDRVMAAVSWPRKP
jgi:FixJ family two-component response regulator